MAKDIFHNVVRTSLEKEGWVIIDDPMSIKVGDNQIYIDLSADKILTADKGNEKIAIEIKTFISGSVVFNFHVAIGQFINYQAVLEQIESERKLFLAIPLDIYRTFFQSVLAQSVLAKQDIPLIVYDPQQEEDLQWII